MSTLAHQLALSIPGVAFFIKKALDANPAIARKSVKEQFEKLIQGPLSEAAATATTPSSVVMVIDALDECDQEADIRLLINIFSQAKTLRPHLRVFLTSRPELRFDWGSASCRRIGPGRPAVERLAQMAIPLFIFAATVCRFVGDRKRDSPPIQLRKVLDYESKGHISQLDRTYGPVLRSLITDFSEEDKKQIIKDFKMIIGSIVILANPLSVWALSQLLEVDPEVVDNRLDTLHSVLSIPPRRKAPVRLLHLSFRDYLLANESEFRVDERHTHQTLAKHCLRVMRDGLHENICGLSFPGTRRSTIDDSELEEYIPPQLQYACMYWAYHQMEGNPKSKNSNEAHDFLKTYFIHWVEAMSLLGRIKECLDSLRSLARWLENQEDSSLSTFVADAVRFLQAYFPVIAEAPLQIYSCLILHQARVL
ncbi:hypothetical protein QL093DRAFT_2627939 [Fusarium oxysporum]|nr:hypothetical protein QL093DRAFT_2627939 [Fusarium oxysporum]